MKNIYAAPTLMSFLSFSIKKGSAPFKNSISYSFLLFITMLMIGNSSWAQAPTITSFTPTSGAPGTLFTITGTNLSSPTAFKIGGVTASAIVVSNTGTSLVGMVMPGAATGTVAVTTAGGTATSSGTFTIQNTSYPIVQQGAKMTASNGLVAPNLGWYVALSADGKTALVSGYSDNSFAGATWVYTRSGDTWSQQAKLIGTGNTGNAWQGFSVALSADGNTAIIGGVSDASGKGAVWIFTRSGITWTQQGTKLVASDEVGNAWFGKSVSLSADGNTALVGAYGDNTSVGAAWIFTRSGTTWTQLGTKLVGTGAVGISQQGAALSLSADGNTAAIGGLADNTIIGATWIFTRSGTTWAQQGNKLVGTGATAASKQGQSVALSADGNMLIVGGLDATSNVSNAWVFTRSGTAWSQQGTKLFGSDAVGTAANGTAVSLTADGNTAIMGSVSDNGNKGAAWVFTRSGTTWTQKGNKLLGTGAVGTTLYQGRSIALSADGTNALVGADGDNSGQGAAWSYTTGVVYDGNANSGGTVPSSALATIGSPVTLATNIGTLVKTGYTFAGWNTLANGTGTSYAVSASYSFAGTVTLYAQWTPNNYTITFNPDGGNGGSMSTQSIAYLVSANLTSNGFTRTNYTFAGWATTTGGTVAYANSAPYTMSTAANVTLYAQWTPNIYTITFNVNGGTGTMSNQSIAYLAAANLTPNTFTRTGYTFAGWAKISTATVNEVDYLDNAPYLMSPAANVTLYAVWTLNNYTVTFNINGGQGSIFPQSIAYLASASLKPNTFTRTGYAFASWNTLADGSGISYADVASYTMSAAADATLFAQWIPNNYTLTFNSNGGTGGTMNPQTIAYNASANLTSNGFTRTNYTFAGWATTAGNVVAYADGVNYTMTTAANVTLYAVWTLNKYTITLDANGGTGTMSPQLIAYGDYAFLTSNAFTRAGYTFAGWTTAPDGTGTSYADSDRYTMSAAADATLYAKWTPNNYTVTFNADGGTGTMNPQTIAYNASANLTSNAFTRTGYTFAGWATTAGGTVAYANSAPYTMIATVDVTLYAQWTLNNYTITFDANGGTGTMSPQLIAYLASTNLTANSFTRTDYTFVGWATASGGVVVYADGASYTMSSAANVILFAQWNCNTTVSASSTQTLCVNTPLTDITLTTISASGISTAIGLPTGVTASWANNMITISGTPTELGTFNYSIPLTGGCGSANATGTITVNGASAASSTPTLCINTALTNITHNTFNATGIGTATGLPAGVTALWANDVITISGTPSAAGTFNYSIPLMGGCGSVNATGTITVAANMNASVASSTPTLCINTLLTNITHTTTGATGIGTATDLPSGVSASWLNNILTISGTPSAAGTFNYSIPLMGGCDTATATGTITVTGNMNASVASSTPTLCINTLLTNITHTTTGATGIGTATDLPVGVSASWLNNILTISGTPTASGTFNYSISLTGGCGSANATGTITVNGSSVASSTPTLCINTPLTNITHTTTGATGIGTATDLPSGVSASWLNNILTISGTPSAAGTFNYSIPLMGGCDTATATGTITVTGNMNASVASSTPTLCINTLLTNITHTTTGATGIGTATDLPAGVTASWANNTITISGTPTASGTFNYSIPLTGGCGNANATGTITVNANTVGIASSSPTLCINSPLTNITHTTTDASGIGTPTDLPAGVAALWANDVITISGTPSAAGTFNYSIPLTGGCVSANATGTIIVTADMAVSSPPLDHIPNARLAISLRKLRSAYAGPALRLRRVSDNLEQDFGFAGNDLDVNAIAIWLNGASGYCTKLYDQSGNGGDVSQTTPSAQPLLVLSGFNNKPLLRFTTAQTMNNAVNYPAPFSVIYGSRVIGTSMRVLSAKNNNWLLGYWSGSQDIAFFEGWTSVGSAVTVLNQYNSYAATGTGSISTVYKNGVPIASNGNGLQGPNGIQLNGYGVAASETSDCEFTDVIIYGSALTAATIAQLSDPNGVNYEHNRTLCINTPLTNIIYTTIRASGIGTGTNLPAGVTASWANNTITISGTPTTAGTFNYSVPLTGGCGNVNATGTITVTTENMIAGVASSSPTLCINSPLTNITHTTTDALGIGTATDLPVGVSASWLNNILTISGTPTASGTFNYSIPLTGGCGNANATGTITVNANTVGIASSSPTLCINSPLTNITHTTTGASGIGTATGLPAGVAALWANNTITISGTQIVTGAFNYSIPLTGGCGNVNATGTITVNGVSVASSTPMLCINTPLTNITHTTTGASGIGTATGLPSGITASWTNNTITISGTPIVVGTFNYSIPLTGGCVNVNATGTITVIGGNMITGAASSTPTLCVNTALTNITHTTTAATGIASLTLPTYTLPPAISNPTISVDLGNVTITLNGATVLNNGTPINSLSGTIGTAIGTAGSYADFTAFGPYAMYPGSTYSFSLSSITPRFYFNNSMAIYIDYNRNGLFSDAGEKVYAAATTTSGSHTETGTFTIPSSASVGLTRMRVISNEGIISSPTESIIYGEYEEYSLNIGGFLPLPPGVSASWANNTITISGSPTASGTFNYSIPLTGGCDTATATGTITVNPADPLQPSAGSNGNLTICSTTNLTDALLFGALTGTPALGGVWSPTPNAANGSMTYTYIQTGIAPCANAIATVAVIVQTIVIGNDLSSTVVTGQNSTITPNVAPASGTALVAYTNTNFKGLINVNSTTGTVTITNAHPAGIYSVIVKTPNEGCVFATIALTVSNPLCSQGQFYAPAIPEVAVGTDPSSVAIGDFNGDGKQDMAIANYLSISVSIRLGDGLGGFSGNTNVAVGAHPNSVAVGDFNKDGNQDIAAANEEGIVSIRLGDGLGGFSGTTEVAVGANPQSVAIGDFNGDGAPDFATANNDASGTVSIRLGDGLGGFSGTSEIAVGANPRSVAIGDFNGDGKQDMAIANSGFSSSSVSIRLGDGLGGFSGNTNVAVQYYGTSSTESVAIGDFNSDGKQDFASVDSYSDRVFIRLGDGLGGFSGNTNVAAGDTPKSVAIGDFNGDGKLDFATTNYYLNTVSIRLGDGLGGFSGSTEFAVGTNPRSVAVGDFNGDGKQDIATANYNSSSVSIRLGGIGDINLKGNSIDIATGDTSPSAADHTDFGSGGNTNTRTFTIQSTGPAPITINTIGTSGADASKFSIIGIVLPINIAVGTEASFNIVSTDYSATIKTATITINNGDCGEVAYNFAIQAGSIIPTLGVYGDATIANAGGSTLVTPSVIPSGTNFTAYTTTNFKGTLAVNNTTGVLSITNAHPAGNYTVTVNALGVLYNFTLTVGNTLCSQGQLYAPATPEVTVGTNPRSVAIGDFNGDGKQDMAIANYGVEWISFGSVSIRLGDGMGGFSGTTEVTVATNPRSVAIGDFNGDGKQDFAANNEYGGTVSIRLGDGLGGFSGGYNLNVGNNYDTGTLALGDFNGDGKQDFACSSWGYDKIFIRLGDGLGGFSGTALTDIYDVSSLLISDINNDGKQDIVEVSYGRVYIRLGDGLGGFGAATYTGSTYSYSGNPNAVALGDFNGDGNQDFVVSNTEVWFNTRTSFYIYLGNGLGGFTPGPAGMATGGTANNVAVGDFNGDGIQDIATTVPSGNVIIYLGDNTGLFKAITPSIAVGANPSSLAIGDFDGDGKQDVVTTNYDGGTISIRLTSPNQAEINLKANTIAIPNGNTSIATADNTDFGNGFNTTLAYTIQNTGTGALTIKSIGISGTDAALFTKSGITLPATIAAGSETTFNLNYFSTTLGTKTATVTINNDDCDEGAYTFNVQATSLVPTLGNYAATTLPTAGGNATITPSAAPTNKGLGITVKTSVDFKGKLTVDAATGAVRITNANPAGTYQITVNTGFGVSQTFALTVGNTLCSQGQFLPATFLSVGLKAAYTEVADFNNDGYQDFAVALNATRAVAIQLGNGSGGFTTVTTLTFSESIFYLTINDFNGDGNADMVVRGGNNLYIRLGDGLGGFTSGATINITSIGGFQSILSDDLDQDSKMDFVVTGTLGFAVFKGNGQGGFSLLNTYNNGIPLTYIEKGDFNGDGFTDLSMSRQSLGDKYIYFGNGNGGFGVATIYNLGSFSGFSTVGDFDGDGKSDILSALGNTPGTVAFQKNNGDGTFATPTYIAVGDSPQQAVSGDFNGDGKLDFATTNFTLSTVSVRYGNGDGTFYGSTELLTNAPPGTAGYFRLIVGDFNNDGVQDIGTSENFSTTNNFSVFLGAPNVAEINLKGNTVDIVSGDNTPDVADDTDFGTINSYTPSTKTYTIENTGTGLLNIKNIVLSGLDASSYFVGGITLPATIAAGASTTFTVTVNAVTIGTKTATVTINNDDCDERAYTFSVKAVVQVNTTTFNSTWRTTSANESVTIPILGSNITINWGDGTSTTAVNNPLGANNPTHTYAVAGDYQVVISGSYDRTFFDWANNSEAIKIISINQWGTNAWTSMENAFFGCENLSIIAADVPVLTNVTSMRFMFFATNISGNLNNWDVSTISDMSIMFSLTNAINLTISNWNVSSVSNMDEMFSSATNIPDISNWDVSNVTSMREMFYYTSNIPDLSSWNVSQVIDMHRMFFIASGIPDISSWDVGNVTNMGSMFRSSDFNQDIGSWDVSNVTDMSVMFGGATAFNQNIGSWNVSFVTDMSGMFGGATAFNQNISSWNVSNVGSMQNMFSGATAFNQNIGSWNVSFVNSMQNMFSGATAFNQNIGSWNVSNVNDMSGMFSGVTLSTPNYDALLMGWAPQINWPYILFDGGNSKYCAGASARQSMIDYGWTITDGGKNLAEINLEGNSVAINSLVSPTAITDFGKVVLNTSVTRTFIITNPGIPGISQFTISSGIYVNGTDAALFSVSNLSSTAVPGGASVTYDVTFTPTTVGNKTAYLIISHDDGIDSIADINIQGKGVVSIATAPSVSNDTDFGTVAPNAPVTKTYTIQNTGSDPLLVNSIDLTGTNAANFVVGGITLPATIAAGTESTFTLKFTPTTVGLETATVAINTNVCAISSYTFAVQGSGSCVAATWTGSISTAWNTSGNWSCGIVPDAASDVTIAVATNQPVLSTNVSIHTLTLEALTTMTVPTGLNLTVSNYIHNSGTLTVANNANLIQVDNVINTGNVIVYRDSAPIVRLDHTLWSSPVDSQNLFTFSPATLTNRFYTYDTSSNAYTNVGLNANSTFEIGKGFAVRAPNNQTAVAPTAWQGTFTGVPNNGTIPFTLNTTLGYNLVGNPYPSTIDAATFIAANPNIVGTLYYYAHSLSMDANGVFPQGTNYATWNSLGSTAATHILNDVHFMPVAPSGTIQVGQGFFVKATGSGTINFTNAMRVGNNDNQNFRTAAVEKDRLWLNLKTETGVDINQILVGYITGATQGVDRNYDGLSFGNTGSYISSKIAGDDYAIQGRSLPFDSSDIVPLGFKADTAGNYTIALTNSDGVFAGNQEVFLQDNLTGITHNIKGSSYSFTSQTGTFDTRFSLVYAKTLGVDANSLSPNSVQVYKDGEWFRVNTNGITMQEVSVYDLAGRLIYKQSGINDTTTLLKGLSQVQETMLVKIVSQENQTVTVKVIN